MEGKRNYIRILIASLNKKLRILDQISVINKHQKVMAAEEKLDLKKLEPTLDQKQLLIDQLNALDSGFDVLYQKVKQELNDRPELYKEEIKELQSLIPIIAEKGLVVQAEEERNRRVIQRHFNIFKKQIRNGKVSSKAATNYYNTMNNLKFVDPAFLDKKK